MAEVRADLAEEAGDHDVVAVHVDDGDEQHDYRVTLTHADLEHWANAGESPTDIVERCVRLLLEREPASQILASFDVRDAVGYFPELETELGRPG